MPTPAFSESDLLLSQKSLDELYRARLNRGLAQPIDGIIAEAISLVRDYTGRYELSADRWRRLVRRLAVHQLLSFPGSAVPDAALRDYEDALRELTEIPRPRRPHGPVGAASPPFPSPSSRCPSPTLPPIPPPDIPMSYPLSSIDILNAVEERISALRWKYERAFTWVARYDRSDLAAALEEGQTVADRICLLVYEGDRFENIHHGRRLHVRRTAQVSLLIADRKSASRAAAVFGSPDNPGAVALKDLVLGLWPRVPSDPIPVPGLLLTTEAIIAEVPEVEDEGHGAGHHHHH